jgi:hypothetical protein
VIGKRAKGGYHTVNQGEGIGSPKKFHKNSWQKDKKSTKQWFYVTNLGTDCVLLGYPWLREFNPQINWTKGVVKGGQVALKEQGVWWHEWQQQ